MGVDLSHNAAPPPSLSIMLAIHNYAENLTIQHESGRGRGKVGKVQIIDQAGIES